LIETQNGALNVGTDKDSKDGMLELAGRSVNDKEAAWKKELCSGALPSLSSVCLVSQCRYFDIFITCKGLVTHSTSFISLLSSCDTCNFSIVTYTIHHTPTTTCCGCRRKELRQKENGVINRTRRAVDAERCPTTFKRQPAPRADIPARRCDRSTGEKRPSVVVPQVLDVCNT